MKNILIVGIGNLLMGDDGLGIHAIRELRKFKFPEYVKILDGATNAIDLLHFLEDKTHVIFIDAINLDKKPGEFILLEKEDLRNYLNFKVGPHEIGIHDLLLTAELLDIIPENIVVVGLQPERIAPSTELSTTLNNKLNLLINSILKILAKWNVSINA